MYNKDLVTPFQSDDNQRDCNIVPQGISGESVIIDQPMSHMEHIYQSMLAKWHTNIKISGITTEIL